MNACQARATRAPEPPAAPAPADPTPAPSEGPPFAASRTVTRLDKAARPAWFLCDGTNEPRIAVVERDAAGKSAAITWVDKRTGAPAQPQRYALGEPSAGAGQVYYSLSRDGQEVGNIHTINPGMLPEPARALTPPVTSVRMQDVQLSCRWMLGVRVLGFDGRRSVLVTQEGSTLTYRSFDFARAAASKPIPVEGYGSTNEPSQTVTGGREARTPGGSTFTFSHEGFTYVVAVGSEASLEVQREGQSVQRTDLLAWTYAPPP